MSHIHGVDNRCIGYSSNILYCRCEQDSERNILTRRVNPWCMEDIIAHIQAHAQRRGSKNLTGGPWIESPLGPCGPGGP